MYIYNMGSVLSLNTQCILQPHAQSAQNVLSKCTIVHNMCNDNNLATQPIHSSENTQTYTHKEQPCSIDDNVAPNIYTLQAIQCTIK
jgi:hypothetical protein